MSEKQNGTTRRVGANFVGSVSSFSKVYLPRVVLEA